MARSSKRRSSRAKKTGPTIGDLIVDAVSASKERSGVSLPTLKKLLAAKGYDVKKNKARIKTAIKNLVTKGTLVQVKGSFKMGKKEIKLVIRVKLEVRNENKIEIHNTESKWSVNVYILCSITCSLNYSLMKPS
uniref:H15 domain-containing protein n=1 Tax=Mola mola TaxID=94237 RepID=A0A3Q3W7M5_MOLML